MINSFLPADSLSKYLIYCRLSQEKVHARSHTAHLHYDKMDDMVEEEDAEKHPWIAEIMRIADTFHRNGHCLTLTTLLNA